MTEAKASLMASLGRPGLLIAGRHSRVVGADNAEAAARGWGLPLRWFERSGHFVYVEAPESFAAAVIEAAAR